MYYFELFDLPISLQLNKAAILKKYYQLSKEFHPDKYSLQDDAAQETALRMSTEVNKAKYMLDDNYRRLAYILKEKDIIEDDEKYQLSPQFLGEMMDINEQLMELEFDNNELVRQKIKTEVDTISNLLFQDVKAYYDMKNLESENVNYTKLKDYYYKLKYLNRILEKLN